MAKKNKDKDNVVGLFSDKNLIEFLEDCLEKAKKGTLKRMVSISGEENNTAFAVMGIETMQEMTEMVGNVELLKMHLTVSIMETQQQGE